MRRLGELDNIQLLYDVKADALQPIDELVDDSQIGTLVDFSLTVWKTSIEKLEREIRYYPMDIPLFVDAVCGVKQIRDDTLHITGQLNEENIIAIQDWRRGLKIEEFATRT